MKTGINLFCELGRYKNGVIGLVTNNTGRLTSGELTVDAIINGGWNLKALFSPEHGLFGVIQDGIKTLDFTYRGIPVYSLYGHNRKPKQSQLEGLDYILFDIQDIGSRFYTYLYTLAYVMEAAVEAGIPVIVMDRPAPLGRKIEGNRISKGYNSFVGSYGLPIRTGLTIGEYAVYLKQNYISEAEIEVIKMDGWDGKLWDSNNPWLNPSPNIPSINSALVYSGTCLIEGTDISEGRGTTRPFETIGAPGIDGRELSRTLNNYNLDGVDFLFTIFKPEFSKHKGMVCEGVQLNITDSDLFQPLKTGVALIGTIYTLYQDKVNIRPIDIQGEKCFLDKLTGSEEFRRKLSGGENWENLYTILTNKEKDFIPFRDKAILY